MGTLYKVEADDDSNLHVYKYVDQNFEVFVPKQSDFNIGLRNILGHGGETMSEKQAREARSATPQPFHDSLYREQLVEYLAENNFEL